MTRILVAAITLLAAAATTRADDAAGPRRAIFAARDAQGAADTWSYLGAAPPYWTPEAADVDGLEAGLEAYLRSAPVDGAARTAGRLADYRRQYVGFHVDGRRRILINAFCSIHVRHDAAWTQHAVLVYDGGDCSFRAVYDPASGRFGALSITDRE